MKRQRDENHLHRIRQLPCLTCGGPSPDAAHIRYSDLRLGKRATGMGEKPSDWFVVPLCRPCHSKQHAGNERAFWERRGINPIVIAQALYLAPDHETCCQIIAANRGTNE